ncbi:hypothetical protein H6P81_006681 [Aristolochia fimbriata]|uniref:LAGLIDADG homing endonuclease n=1 Tax=Aristolochia fimbriata TaxID=158543 RepID=A0AAV7F1F9_ARIFI|nr:hypothetical protein H6P81_006681 [Aristolochia fimbriata]
MPTSRIILSVWQIYDAHFGAYALSHSVLPQASFSYDSSQFRVLAHTHNGQQTFHSRFTEPPFIFLFHGKDKKFNCLHFKLLEDMGLTSEQQIKKTNSHHQENPAGPNFTSDHLRQHTYETRLKWQIGILSLEETEKSGRAFVTRMIPYSGNLQERLFKKRMTTDHPEKSSYGGWKF